MIIAVKGNFVILVHEIVKLLFALRLCLHFVFQCVFEIFPVFYIVKVGSGTAAAFAHYIAVILAVPISHLAAV